MTAAAEAVGVAVVVDHLVFDPEPLALALGVLDVGDPVLDAVVALGFEAPFPGEFEVHVFFLRDQRAGALLGDETDDAAFFGLPAAGGGAAVEVGEVGQGEGGLFAGEEGAGGEQGEEEGFHGETVFMGSIPADLKSFVGGQGRTLISLSQTSASACHLSHEGPL